MPDWLIDWLTDPSVAFFCRSSPWLCECCIPSSCWIAQLLRGPSLNLMKMNYVGCAVWSSMHNWCLIAVWWKWIRIHTVDGIFFDVSVRIIVMDSWCDVFVFFSKHRNTLEQNRTDMCLECAFSFLPILFIFFSFFRRMRHSSAKKNRSDHIFCVSELYACVVSEANSPAINHNSEITEDTTRTHPIQTFGSVSSIK